MQTEQGITALQTLFSGLPVKTAVEQAEVACLQLPQVPCPVLHSFGPGIYIREVHIPADTLSIGHYQRTEHLNIMLKGRVTMLLENGELSEVVAPAMFTAKPGRKIGYIHEDMVWLNVYATTETDVEKLEAMFLIKSDPWQENNNMQNSIEKLNRVVDREDYKQALRELGVTEEIVRSQSENIDDMRPLPYGAWKIMIADSPIEGKGLFATADIEAGDLIAPARISECRTIAGRFTNHGKNPNAEMFLLPNGDIELVAISDIKGCAGGYTGEEITIDYRKAAALSGGASCQV